MSTLIRPVSDLTGDPNWLEPAGAGAVHWNTALWSKINDGTNVNTASCTVSYDPGVGFGYDTGQAVVQFATTSSPAVGVPVTARFSVRATLVSGALPADNYPGSSAGDLRYLYSVYLSSAATIGNAGSGRTLLYGQNAGGAGGTPALVVDGNWINVSFLIDATTLATWASYGDWATGLCAEFRVQAGYEATEVGKIRFELGYLEFEIGTPTGWWTLDPTGPAAAGGPLAGWYTQATTIPSAISLDYSFVWAGVFYPVGHEFTWTPYVGVPSDTGWWSSFEQYRGSAPALFNTRPKDPRSYHEIGTFATSTASALGGFPGPCGTWNNKLIYSPGGYTVGTTSPTLRLFDGSFDREVCTIPNTAAGAIPKAVMTILVANGNVYLSTFDSGTSSADWAGRVFVFDVETGKLTPLGDAFTTGQLPYALAWHNGRLWCGTNRQVATSSGKVYYFRPGVDTTWTAEYDLSTASMGGVASLLSYKGLLYIGCTAPAATFAKVLVRGTDNAYSTSTTASGGTAVANNGYLAMVEFGSNLYASYWNNDATPKSLIKKFDGTTWSTAYTGASTTLVPYVGFPADSGFLLAIGGGAGYDAVLLSTEDGITWANRTAFLTQQPGHSTGLPAFGVVVN